MAYLMNGIGGNWIFIWKELEHHITKLSSTRLNNLNFQIITMKILNSIDFVSNLGRPT